MTKTAVQVELVYIENEKETLRFHAVLQDGKLASPEMYCHLYELNAKNSYEVQPGILHAEDGNFRRYQGEWGYDDTSDVTIEFLDRPLEVGQEITRTDKSDGLKYTSIYRITGITDLLA
ncbi:hypothetical protein ACV344_29690 [Pseudomonas aeruginosa]|uniref:hypothetical protein n=1 Tax=Pseudomonas aeruginosa TaxID=287 RepID=UPI000F542603|nr:hypothetical protein [Pseudomonas aeruginosa]MBA5106181.1 hypothetical protein [Pseudomonas aeruginosa]MBD1300209.1 hypothetical protein [Pseudomonas aeruginosa]MBD1340808.1 hypothetical protein [Pseudomonas aeruginosa]MBG4604213.1 hypothetical protein [Pseudomonas aeruginosa]MBH3592949.1 hypothetical protein [Pseudomonas aeruginosa]